MEPTLMPETMKRAHLFITLLGKAFLTSNTMELLTRNQVLGIDEEFNPQPVSLNNSTKIFYIPIDSIITTLLPKSRLK
jgi:hypothetical protein